MRKAKPCPSRLAAAIWYDGRSKGEIAEAAGISNRQVLTNILSGKGGGAHVGGLDRALKVDRRWLTHGENEPAWMRLYSARA